MFFGKNLKSYAILNIIVAITSGCSNYALYTICEAVSLCVCSCYGIKMGFLFYYLGFWDHAVKLQQGFTEKSKLGISAVIPKHKIDKAVLNTDFTSVIWVPKSNCLMTRSHFCTTRERISLQSSVKNKFNSGQKWWSSEIAKLKE